ncbi:acyl-CoA dehydrogenase [Candidatus Uabimicrobium amorphum]|uniref:Short/branched chain specific acyl-CoA dehydrogenase, mitochondrial n=1 Tax=Uabimicrobium amorphum TaxID=2596890 RepID=A0A5S9IVU6_UABAM|nr:acyl-CoA dehydrogenase [Candidatus Uabimicrobium amorphum]BBM88211.1 acyl-CoA dehydrogenase [Candidatus Uabimicrobium amorphum]
MSQLPTSLNVYSEDEMMFRDTVRKFAQNKLKPVVSEMEKNEKIAPEIIKELFDLGLMSVEIPEDYDGTGANFTSSIIVVEEISSVDPSVGVMVDVQNTLVNNAFIRWGTDEQKQKYLPQLATGKIGAYSLSEAGSGSDAFALRVTAEDKGDHYVLNGEKMWVTNGGEAGIFIVFASVDREKGYKGITGFIVERDFPGFSIGKKEDKLGIRASSTCSLILDNCKVPKENVLGEVGKGYKIAIETLNEGRIGIGAQMVGLSRGALEYAINYTKERKQFGKTIGEFQGMQFLLADLATQLEAARLMVYNASRLKDAGLPFVKEAAMAKYLSSTTAERISSKAIEILGGYGYTKEYPIEKFYRDSKIGQIYEGTTHMQLMTIAKML